MLQQWNELKPMSSARPSVNELKMAIERTESALYNLQYINLPLAAKQQRQFAPIIAKLYFITQAVNTKEAHLWMLDISSTASKPGRQIRKEIKDLQAELAYLQDELKTEQLLAQSSRFYNSPFSSCTGRDPQHPPEEKTGKQITSAFRA